MRKYRNDDILSQQTFFSNAVKEVEKSVDFVDSFMTTADYDTSWVKTFDKASTEMQNWHIYKTINELKHRYFKDTDYLEDVCCMFSVQDAELHTKTHNLSNPDFLSIWLHILGHGILNKEKQSNKKYMQDCNYSKEEEEASCAVFAILVMRKWLKIPRLTPILLYFVVDMIIEKHEHNSVRIPRVLHLGTTLYVNYFIETRGYLPHER